MPGSNQFGRHALPAILAGLLALGPTTVRACDWDRAVPEPRIDAFTWEAIAEGAGMEIGEMLEHGGRIVVAPAFRATGPEGHLCVSLETQATCSMGIAVCAHLVIGPYPARLLLLETAAHDLIAHPPAGAGQAPEFTAVVQRHTVTERWRYRMQADGTYDSMN